MEIVKKIYMRVINSFIPRSFFIQKLPWSMRSSHDVLTYITDYNRRCDTLTCDGVRVTQLLILIDLAKKCIEGDFAELGTYRGNFARIIYQLKPEHSRLVCFDTFQGFDHRDVDVETEKTSVNAKAGEFSNTNAAFVCHEIAGRSSPPDDLELAVGYFPETFSVYNNRKWRFVSLDADLYEPMKSGIECFWPQIVPGGVLMIHDYLGGYFGSRKAIDEYFKPLGIFPVPIPDAAGTAVVIKPANPA